MIFICLSSVVMWVPYNEGWGQPSADKTRHTNKRLKRYDKTRLIDGPSGWNDYEGGYTPGYAKWNYANVSDGEIYTDCIDMHHYPEANMHWPNSKRASFLGEFGGLGVALEGHVLNPTGDKHNLKDVNDPEWKKGQHGHYTWYMQKVTKLAGEGLSGSIFTNAIDQFWELCGFVTFDRAIIKLDYDVLQQIHEKVYNASRNQK